MLTNDTISSLRTPLEKNSKITPSNRPMAHCIHLKKRAICFSLITFLDKKRTHSYLEVHSVLSSWSQNIGAKGKYYKKKRVLALFICFLKRLVTVFTNFQTHRNVCIYCMIGTLIVNISLICCVKIV